MKRKRAEARGKQDRMITRLGACLIEGIRKTKRITLVAAVVAGSLLISCKSEEPAKPEKKAKVQIVEKDAKVGRTAAKKKKAFKDIDWKRTHMIILNGDVDPMHWESALLAVKAGMDNEAAGLQIAGLNRKKDERTGAYAPAYLIDPAKINRILGKAEKDSTAGDTVLIYLSGHKPRPMFAARRGDSLDHRYLPERIMSILRKRRVILITDSAPCRCFVEELAGNNGSPGITLISPQETTPEAPCKLFIRPFWHALNTGLDADGDGYGGLRDSYKHAMSKYRLSSPLSKGIFREPVAIIKDLKGIKEGVVMTSASWCPACRMMEPVFQAMNFIMPNGIKFYMIKGDHAAKFGALPSIFIFRGGKKIASKAGAMGLGGFAEWLKENGAIWENTGKNKTTPI